MSAADRTPFDRLPLAVRRVLWPVIEAFEERAAAGPVRVEDFLTDVPPAHVAAVRDELERIAREAQSDTGSAADTPPAVPPPPPRPELPTIPGYTVSAEVGRGGMGVVYLAHEDGLGRRVALKLIHDATGWTQQEAQQLARVEHPNIVRLYRLAAHAGRPYMVMEYVSGGTLAGRVRGHHRDPARDGWDRWFDWVARVVGVIAEAVEAAHQADVVHRDLKPSNVLIDETNEPKVADFGLAVVLGESARADHPAATTPTGGPGLSLVCGTPQYMAPEQMPPPRPRIDHRTDVYGLGAILYECLTGRPPFPRDPAAGRPTPEQIFEEVRAAEPRPVRELNPLVPEDLAAVCRMCLAKEPGGRYQTAAELADDLHRWRTHHPVLARPAGPVRRLKLWARRHVSRRVALAGAAVAVGLAVGFGWYEAGQAAAQRRLNTDLETANARVMSQADELRGTNTRLRDETARANAKTAEVEAANAQLTEERNRVRAQSEVIAKLSRVPAANLGILALGQSHPMAKTPGSVRALEEALAEFEQIPPEYVTAEMRRMAAMSYMILGMRQFDDRRPAAAESNFGKAVWHFRHVILNDPTDVVARNDSCNALYFLGAICRDTDRPAEHRWYWDVCRAESEATVRAFPKVRGLTANLGRLYFNQGVLDAQEGRLPEATAVFTRAVTTLSPITAPWTPDAWFLAASHEVRGDIRLTDVQPLDSADDYVEAARWAEHAAQRKELLLRVGGEFGKWDADPAVLVKLARVYAVGAKAATLDPKLSVVAREAEARKWATRAVGFLTAAKNAGAFADPDVLTALLDEDDFSEVPREIE